MRSPFLTCHWKMLLAATMVVASADALLNWGNPYNGQEYALPQNSSEENYTWYSARNLCMEEGGDLVTLETPEESAWVSGIDTPYYESMWIGLNKLSGEWRWSSHRNSSLNKWCANHPAADKLCAYKSSRTRQCWSSENCADNKGYLCRRPAGLSTHTPRTAMTTPAVGGFCPHGYASAGTDRCYKFFGPISMRISWEAAREECRKEPHYKADLACVTDQKEIALLTRLSLEFPTTDQFFIGIYRTDSYGEFWKWADNSAVGLTNWNDLPSDKGCGFISSGLKPPGSWNSDTTCNTLKQGYVCQIMKDPNSVITTVGPTKPSSCSSGYISFKEGCYQSKQGIGSWQKGKELCQEDDAAMVHIHDTSENAAIQYLLLNQKVKSAWVGLRFTTLPTPAYRWDNGWYVNYTPWGDGQPKRQEGGGCVALHAEDGRWYDTLCDEELPVLCKTTTAEPVTEPPHQPGICPSADWLSLGGKCYHVCGQGSCLKSWEDQAASCKMLHLSAKMASIHDEATNDVVYKALLDSSRYGDGDAWLGMFRSVQQGHWRWLDGSPVQYTNFVDGHPSTDPGDGKDCVYMSLDPLARGKWFSSECHTRRGHICEMDKIDSSSTPAPVKGTCPGDTWTKHGFSCFLFRPEELRTWDQAQQACVDEGGPSATLTTVKTWGESNFLHSGMLNASRFALTKKFWIGLSKSGESESYRWMDGSKLGNFEQWARNQPNKEPKHNCVLASIKTSQWQNELCYRYWGYACQAPMVSGVSSNGSSLSTIFSIIVGMLAAVIPIAL